MINTNKFVFLYPQEDIFEIENNACGIRLSKGREKRFRRELKRLGGMKKELVLGEGITRKEREHLDNFTLAY